MDSRCIVLCWFSGTGNTRLVIREMIRCFIGSDIEVTEHHITQGSSPELPAGTALGIGFPVAYQSTYPFIWDFVDRLPPGDGREAFMVATLGGFSGGIVGPLGALLRKKGYRTIGAAEIRMPMNFSRTEKGRGRDHTVISMGIQRAESFACELVEGRSRWGRVPLLSDLMFLVHALFITLLFTRWNQRKFSLTADHALCTGCSACEGSCPVGNISMMAEGNGHAIPEFGDRCEFCLHCVAACPSEAIRFRLNRHGRYSVLPRQTDNSGLEHSDEQ